MKNIPVLFFFTGLHSDYHKPSDDADKINFVGEEKLVRYIYKLIGELNKKDKLDFTKTREKKMDGVGFKVTLGIMPDYTFSGNGVRADGITDGKVGSKAGMKAGDIITQLGDYKILDMQSYMVALSKFKKGDATKVKVLRAKEELEMNVVFE
jgi:C-terminal processing protease CtpA/Prc